MSNEYVIDRPKDDRDPSPPRPLRVARQALKVRTEPHRDKGFSVRTRDGEYGRRMGWLAARLRVWAWQVRGHAGTKVFIKALSDNTVWAITKVSDDPRIVDLGCAPELERMHAYAWEWGKTHGGVRSGGRWYCRFVLGTRTVSRHGYLGTGWKGAAEDIFVVSDRMSDLFDLAYHMVGLAQAGDIHPHAFVVGDQEWRPGEGWTRYDGEYHRHLHQDVPDGWACHP